MLYPAVTARLADCSLHLMIWSDLCQLIFPRSLSIESYQIVTFWWLEIGRLLVESVGSLTNLAGTYVSSSITTIGYRIDICWK
jgi:hypothetical protein